MQSMWSDTQSRFSIDPGRVYAAGMSGGARVACGFAENGNFLTGVIAFAAGFPGAQAPKKGGFMFFGAAGVDDFNYPEVRQLDKDLEKLGMTKRIVGFDGGHGWPPAAVCTRAIAWLELQSMKAGKMPRDNAMINEFFATEEASIREAGTAGRAGEAYLLTSALADDFRGLKDISSLESSAARLAASREVKRYLQEEKELQATQNRRSAEIFALWNQRSASGDPPPAMASVSSLLEELDRQSKAASDSARRRIARRVLQGSYVRASEECRGLLEQKDYPGAARMLELAVAIHPDRPQILFNLAVIYAKARDRKKALEALRKAAERGFRDGAAVESEDSFQFIRADPAMKKILTQMQKP
jgi:tetratricopeptide (TPR) repeat protein